VSLRGRLLAAFAYVVVLVLVAVGIPFALSISHRVEAEVQSQTSGQAHLIAASAAGRLDDAAALRRLVERAAADVDGRVVIVDARGRLVADSAGSRLLGASYRDRPEIAAALRSGRVQEGKRRSDTLGEQLLFAAVAIVEEGRRTGAVRVTRSTAPIDERVRRDLLVLAAIGAGALLLGLALAWLLARSLAGPLGGLASAARRFGRGELDARAEVTGSREQQELAASFNDMAARLDRVLQAQREFVANASHQLRTPLTGLRLRIEAAGMKADDPGLERDLAAAEHETVRLERVLAALLTLAREGADTGPPRPVDLGAAAADACERWRVEAEASGRTVDCAGDGEAWAGASDEDVAIVLDNLVENALAYGEEVTLEWGVREARAWLAVLDRGPGLGADDPERLFERFARGTAGRTAPGTGLGLAIVRTLARRWGGDATIADRPGGGARAEVTLPLAAARAREEATVA
jgi:two-component system, OmpR family, sensor kinase